MEGVALKREPIGGVRSREDAADNMTVAALLRDARKAVEGGTLPRETLVSLQDRIASGDTSAVFELKGLVSGAPSPEAASVAPAPAPDEENASEAPRTLAFGRTRLGYHPDRAGVAPREVQPTEGVSQESPEERVHTEDVKAASVDASDAPDVAEEAVESGASLEKRVEDIHAQLANAVNLLALLGKKEYQSYIETYKEATLYFDRSDLTPVEQRDFASVVARLEEKAKEISGNVVAANDNVAQPATEGRGNEVAFEQPTDISKAVPKPKESAVSSFDEMSGARKSKSHDIRPVTGSGKEEAAAAEVGAVGRIVADQREQGTSLEIGRELEGLLKDWFGGTGWFGHGESGLRHPAYLALRGVTMNYILQNDLKESVRKRVKSKVVKDVMGDIKEKVTLWKDTLAVEPILEETFGEYLERVVRANLKRYGSTQ